MQKRNVSFINHQLLEMQKSVVHKFAENFSSATHELLCILHANVVHWIKLSPMKQHFKQAPGFLPPSGGENPSIKMVSEVQTATGGTHETQAPGFHLVRALHYFIFIDYYASVVIACCCWELQLPRWWLKLSGASAALKNTEYRWQWVWGYACFSFRSPHHPLPPFCEPFTTKWKNREGDERK